MFYDESSDLNWKLLLTELIALSVFAVLCGFLIFSILPISTAIIISVLNVLAFGRLRHRVSAAQHFWGLFALWFLLNIIIYILIITCGRSPFGWFLDWS